MTVSKKFSAKAALLQALDELLHKKPFQKISVNELCEKAQISRSAFYANFEDKYQLFSYCLNQKKELLEQLMESYPPEDFLIGILNFIQQEDRFFYNAFGPSNGEEIQDILYHFLEFGFTRILKQKEKTDSILSGPVEMVSAFYIGGITSMILKWIKSNYELPKEELAACQYALLKEFF